MVGIFLEMSKKVGIFMIISQTLLHLGIARTYEKYIRLVISFMVAAQIIFSFAALFQVEDSDFFEFLEKDFQEEWKNEVKKFDDDLQEIQEQIYEKMKIDIEDLDGNKTSAESSEKIQVGKIRIE